MNQQTEKQLLLVDTIPSFATELYQLLEEQGEPDLAAQVPALVILDRCRCTDDICATFYTQPKPKGGFGPGHRNMHLMPEEGMLILDVVAGEIACVEVLDRNDVRENLDEATFPAPSGEPTRAEALACAHPSGRAPLQDRVAQPIPCRLAMPPMWWTDAGHRKAYR
jgi:hypothetical protein